VNAATLSRLPSLSQVHGWQTEHLTAAASRWKAAADTWTSVYGDVADGLPTPAGTAWEGPASQAAQARMSRDQAGVQTVAQRLQVGARIADNGAQVIDAAKQEALKVVAVAHTLGFDVQEDLSVVDRLSSWPPPVSQMRQRQAELLGMNVKMGAAHLAALDQQVATDMNTVTSGFDALDFKQHPIIEPMSAEDTQSFGQCWADDFKDDVGMGMVRGALTGGVFGALRGAAVGVFFGGPVGVFGGAVLGFVGGAAGGAMITGPLLTAGKSVWDCV
jgi:hypothetical protein